MKRVMKFRSKPAAYATLLAAALFQTEAANATNLLTNGHFTSRSSIQAVQSYSCGGPSSATNWTTWINATVCFVNSGVELEIDMLVGPSPTTTIPPAHLIHVKSRVLDPAVAAQIQANGADGLVQVFGPFNTGPAKVLASVWVYVVHGQVGIGVGNGGDTSISAKSSVLGQWQQLVTFNSVAPANEFVLYSSLSEGSEFYADDAIVCPAETAAELERCQELIGFPPSRIFP